MIVSLPQNTHSSNQHIGKLLSLLPTITLTLDLNLPFSLLLLPLYPHNFGIELYVPSQIPLITRLLNILEYLVAVGIKPTPVRVRVEWECLLIRCVSNNHNISHPVASLPPKGEKGRRMRRLLTYKCAGTSH